MTTRSDVIAKALSQNGVGDGEGYPGKSNPADPWLGRSNEFWCADWVTYLFAVTGIPLPLMQKGMPGKQTGFAFCPSGEAAAKAESAWIPSWEAVACDLFLFDWNGDGEADHVEMLTSRSGSLVDTIGGDSGPSNIDSFRGQGGVHRHSWDDPVNVGNHVILGAISVGKLVTFDQPQPPHHQPPPGPTVPGWYTRLLAYPVPKTPGTVTHVRLSDGTIVPMQKGYDVEIVQRKIGASVDGVYGPNTATRVKTYQGHHGIHVDGVVGPQTAAVMGPR